MQPNRFDRHIGKRLLNFRPRNNGNSLWKNIAHELDSLDQNRKRKIAAIPYFLIASFFVVGWLFSNDGLKLQNNVISYASQAFQSFSLSLPMPEKILSYTSKKPTKTIQRLSFNSNEIKIAVQDKTIAPIITKSEMGLLDLPVQSIEIESSNNRKIKKLPLNRHQSALGKLTFMRSVQWDNAATAGRGHDFLAEVNSSLSRSSQGFVSYANFAAAGLHLRNSRTVVSLYHAHSFNEYNSGMQTSLKISTHIIQKSWGTLLAGVGIGYLTRKNYKMPLDAMPIVVNTNTNDIDDNFTKINALGVEAGAVFISKNFQLGFSAVNLNRPQLSPSKYNHRDPISWEITSALNLNILGVNVCPNITLRNNPRPNADVMIFSKYKTVVVGAGFREMNNIEKKISPTLYGEIGIAKNLRANAEIEFSANRNQITHYGISSKGDIYSFGLKYSLN